jgi:hypothetical protein
MSYGPTYARFHADAPRREAAGCDSWYARGAHFVVAVSRVPAGGRLSRQGQADEYMALLPASGALIRAGGEQLEAGADSLTIVPPGDSELVAREPGLVVRLFTAQSADLVALAQNAGTYASGAPGVAPFVAWPDPPGGFRLRHYRLADHVKPGSNMRLFRCTGLMINVLMTREVPRDVAKLSPHAHADFEQGSLAIAGDYVHYLRWPWVPDLRAWRGDEHPEMGSPSLLVVPPKVIHTSRNVTAPGRLVDLFAPPRLDFSVRPGLVCNADDYPLPVGVVMPDLASGAIA